MAESVLEQRPFPVGAVGRLGVGWWGLLCTIATEGSLLAYLLFTYGYLAVQLPPGDVASSRLSFRYSIAMTIIAIAISAALWWGEQGIRRGLRDRLVIGLAAALVLSVGFVILEGFEWRAEPLTLTSSALGSAFYVTTGVHLAHVVVGIIALAFVLLWSLLGYFNAARNTHVLIAVGYWHFVNAFWVIFFFGLYVLPYLG